MKVAVFAALCGTGFPDNHFEPIFVTALIARNEPVVRLVFRLILRKNKSSLMMGNESYTDLSLMKAVALGIWNFVLIADRP